MRKSVQVIAFLLFVIGCASTGKIEPIITVRTVKVPEARTPRANQFSTVLQIEITNPSNETLTVDRIQLGSVSIGTFTVDPVTERPQKTILPGATDVVEVWAQMRAAETLADGMDPIYIRGSVEFVTQSGAFRRTFVQQVKPSTVPFQ